MSPGEHVVLRQLFRGRVWSAAPSIVVQDAPELRVVWMPPGVDYAYAVGSLFDDWAYAVRVGVRPRGILRLTRPSDFHSLLVFWRGDGSLRGWYVNLERPVAVRPPFVDFEDHLLDVFVEPDGSHRWLDEDELAEAVERGVYSEADAARFRAEGERVLAARPYPTGWEDWLPDPSWKLPSLPDGWDRL